MKKCLKFIAVTALLGIVITGCTETEVEKTETLSQLICTSSISDTEQQYSVIGVNTVTYNESDVVTKVESVETISSSNQDILTAFEETAINTYIDLVSKYGGYEILTSQLSGSIEVVTTIDYEVFNLEQYVQDEPSMNAYVNDKNELTVDNIVKMYEELGGTCEERP